MLLSDWLSSYNLEEMCREREERKVAENSQNLERYKRDIDNDFLFV